MPIPSLLQEIFEEGFQKGLEEAREERREELRREGRAEFVSSALRRRFGTDERIPAIAHRLAAIDPDECVAHLTGAGSLDDLAGPDD